MEYTGKSRVLSLEDGKPSLEIKNTEYKTSLENEKPSSVGEILRLRFWQDFQRANSLVRMSCRQLGNKKSHWINTHIREEHIKQLFIYMGLFFNEMKKLIPCQTPLNYLLPWFIFLIPKYVRYTSFGPRPSVLPAPHSSTQRFIYYQLQNPHSIPLFPAPELQLPARDGHVAWASQPNQNKDELIYSSPL